MHSFVLLPLFKILVVRFIHVAMSSYRSFILLPVISHYMNTPHFIVDGYLGYLQFLVITNIRKCCYGHS